ncbi:MAG: sensor histidine kinase [Roseburia sp.]
MKWNKQKAEGVFAGILCCILASISLGLTLFCVDLDRKNVYAMNFERAFYWSAYDIAEEQAYELLDMVYFNPGENGVDDSWVRMYQKELAESNIHYEILKDGQVYKSVSGEPLEFGLEQENYQDQFEFDFMDDDVFTDYPMSWTDKNSGYCVICQIPYYQDLDFDANDELAQSYLYLNWVYNMDLDVAAPMATVVGWMITLLFLIFFLVKNCRKSVEGETKLKWTDRIPPDLYALGMAALAMGVSFGLACLEYRFAHAWILLVGGWVLGSIYFVLLLFFLRSLCLHVKRKTIWKKCLIYRLGKRFVSFFKKHWPDIKVFISTHWPKVYVWIGKYWKKFWTTIGKGWQALHQHLSVVLRMEALYLVVSAIEAALLYEFGGFAIFYLLFWIKLVGIVVVACLGSQIHTLQQAAEAIEQGKLDYQVNTWGMGWDNRKLARTLEHIGNGMQTALDERMKSEHFKTELITNVSHDIKTPLTSIINYVDLLQQEQPENEKSREYLQVLARQSARLKKLIEDLMEASKAITGSISVQEEPCQVDVMLTQAAGEYEERLKEKQLELIVRKPEESVEIMADGRHLWRVFDNLLNNILKYAQPMTRVYLDLAKKDERVEIIFRNTSRLPLILTGEELKERFVRGDSSRNTEGNGLGLSIAESLTELMKGEFEIHIDGDLFKVVLRFPERNRG